MREFDIVEETARVGISPSFAAPILGIPRKDSPAYRAGLRTFDRINASLAAITTVPANNNNVSKTFQTVKQQLPTAPTLEGFLPSHQVGIAQLAIQYCNELVNDSTKRNAFFPGVNFAAGAKFSNSTGRNAVITPLANAALGTGLNSQDNAGLGTELNALMGKLGCGDGSNCDAAREQVVTKAVCAAAVGSAGVLVN